MSIPERRFPAEPASSPPPVRRPRAQQRRGRAHVLPWLALPAPLLVALVLLLHAAAGAAHETDAIRAARAAAQAEHERLVGYYVSMRRVSGVHDLIRKYAAEYQVDPSFVSAIIARESHYEPYAESSVGARGLMQVMEKTGDWIAGRLGVADYKHEHLYDADVNIRFGTWYLAQLSSQFAGDPVMTAAAYHAGADNVKLWAMRLAKDRKTIALAQIPKADTLDYVTKVMDAYALYYAYDR